MIQAAGGVVWRISAKGALKVLLIHRERYDDWSLPKGKRDPGESHRDAALREVEEETGLRCKLGDELAEVRYRDRKGRAKRVKYWAMKPIRGEFEPNDEVDAVQWVPADRAHELLTYPHDVQIVDMLAELVPVT